MHIKLGKLDFCFSFITLEEMKEIWRSFRMENAIAPPRTITLPDKQLLCLDDKFTGITSEIAKKGIYERGTTELIKRILKRGSVFVDVGAHIGYFTVMASRLIGDSGMVFAFEPYPICYTAIEESVIKNVLKNVFLCRKAVTDNIGEAQLHYGGGDNGANSLYTAGKSLLVKTTSLDKYFGDLPIKIDLVKIDTEGAEYAILKGMKNLIERNKDIKIIVEYMPERLIMAGIPNYQFSDIINFYGFSIRVIDERDGLLIPVENKPEDILAVWNKKTRRNLLLERK